ncbi:Growth arrest and DNA damage-inducible proteins-interacting protein 1 [Operophtera brumata]|uniref:Large ribosomal subunit protein mL64 n=1 Tax=Operophtera brumata TaxID=104452 RepID=A0A0L7KQ96_OPEBR|nr:Growth arrest and DNA damage-inducible proteins-interacting protein 1 [Operophtera brumata]
MNLCVRVRSLRSNLIGSFYRLSTAPAEIDGEASETVLIDDSDDAQAREEQIEKKRNVSRLAEAHYNLVNGQRPYEVPKALAHLTVKYNRKMYGKYGSASGVNPIQEMMDTAAKNRREQKLKILERDRDIADKFEKKERLVEEVRRHFGFKLDPRDERFQEMLVKREKEQKKKERLAKKEAKENMMIAKLQQKNVEISGGNIVVKE